MATTSGLQNSGLISGGGLFTEVKVNCTSTILGHSQVVFIERWSLDAGQEACAGLSMCMPLSLTYVHQSTVISNAWRPNVSCRGSSKLPPTSVASLPACQRTAGLVDGGER